MPIKAVVFDAYGTLYDVQSVFGAAERLCPGRGELVTQVWRLKQLEYSWLRSVMDAYASFDQVTRESLVFALHSAGVTPTGALVEELSAVYLHLDLYPEAMAALDSLQGVRRAILSNGSAAMLDALVEHSGIARFLDAVISVDRAGVFKPARRCYELVEQVLAVPPEEVSFVSSNGFDVAGAKHFGFRVARVDRSPASEGEPSQPVDPARMFRMLRGREEELGFEPDYRIASLTALIGLLG